MALTPTSVRKFHDSFIKTRGMPFESAARWLMLFDYAGISDERVLNQEGRYEFVSRLHNLVEYRKYLHAFSAKSRELSLVDQRACDILHNSIARTMSIKEAAKRKADLEAKKAERAKKELPQPTLAEQVEMALRGIEVGAQQAASFTQAIEEERDGFEADLAEEEEEEI